MVVGWGSSCDSGGGGWLWRIVAHTCDPSSQKKKAEAEGLRIRGQPKQLSEILSLK